MKTLLALSLALFCSIGWSADTPVTRKEAASVFSKMSKILRRVLHISSAAKEFKSGDGIATRDEVLAQLSSYLDLIRPSFRVTTAPQPFDRSVLTLKSSKSVALAEKLSRAGFLDPYGPLIRSRAIGLTPEEFGDVLSYFLSRVAEATHTPNSKFSPGLMPDGGG